MRFIRSAGYHLVKSGKYKASFGIFLCPYCNKEVEKQLGNGKRDKSCGCVYSKLIATTLTKHGDAAKNKTRLYITWAGMKRRCSDKKDDAYKNYGGRGIKVCDEWENDYTAFKIWALENGYEDDLFIDRIDTNGNYESNNCRWTTQKVQQRNRGNNHLVTYEGETHCVAEWAEKLGMKYQTLLRRINYSKWPIKKAFTTTVRT